jgi:hypothetical protein
VDARDTAPWIPFGTLPACPPSCVRVALCRPPPSLAMPQPRAAKGVTSVRCRAVHAGRGRDVWSQGVGEHERNVASLNFATAAVVAARTAAAAPPLQVAPNSLLLRAAPRVFRRAPRCVLLFTQGRRCLLFSGGLRACLVLRGGLRACLVLRGG